jgi:hypothetical protein
MSVIHRGFQKMGVNWTMENDSCYSPRSRSCGFKWMRMPQSLKLRMGMAFFSVRLDERGPGAGHAGDRQHPVFRENVESRMYFVDRLLEMGAKLIQCDPHRVHVVGPARLHGSHLASPDIRAGMALIIAALCARGESKIDLAQVVDRGYEKIDERLRALGADIVREE